MNREYDKAMGRAGGLTRTGIKTRTFVFTVNNMQGSADNAEGVGNNILEEFCESHQVLSAVFNVVGNKLVYFMVYK